MIWTNTKTKVFSMIEVAMSKYKNEIFYFDGIRFDSRREARRFSELKALERSGIIRNLELQKKYELIPPLKLPFPIRKGKRCQRTERGVYYIADFVYEQDENTVVEDVKGYRTKDYIIKRKLMLWRYGIQIREVR